MIVRSEVHWRDLLVGLVALWLMASPLLLGYGLERAPATNAYTVGSALILFCTISAWRLKDLGDEIVNILFGCWLILSPYALAFSDHRAATLNAIAVGVIVILLAVWDLSANPEPEEPNRTTK